MVAPSSLPYLAFAGADSLDHRHVLLPYHDVSHDPPLMSDSGSQKGIEKRGINLRWLSGTILTALTGASLLSAALYISLQGETHFAERPQRVSDLKTQDKTASFTARKADRLVRATIVTANKRSFRAPVTTKVGEREVTRDRPFLRISSALSMTSGTYAQDIPAFNPMKFVSDEPEDKIAYDKTPELSDVDVSVTRADLINQTFDEKAVLSEDNVSSQIAEERRLFTEAGRRQSISLSSQSLLTKTIRPATPFLPAFGASTIDTSFSGLDVRVIPENVSILAKVDQKPGEALIEERQIILKIGETLDFVLRGLGTSQERIRSIISALGGYSRTNSLSEGQIVQVTLGPGARAQDPRQVVRVIVMDQKSTDAVAALTDQGAYVSVSLTDDTMSKPKTKSAVAVASSEEEESEDEGTGVRLYDSLYETAFKNEMSKQAVEDLVKIFGYDVDFQKKVSAEDRFEALYAEDEESSGRNELLYASLEVNGEIHQIYRYQSPEDGSLDYLDDNGRSLRKFLIRKPISEGELRSGFGMRRHPIYGYAKMHTGIDWSNRIGTPILASGNGTVIKATWASGYGRRVELQHANGYVTTYSHMSGFARGITDGVRVRQGQVIGYLGNTGLSTGPHLHYEVMVNGRFVDPLKIRVPRGKELDGRALSEFKRQKEQVDQLLKRKTS